MASESIISLRGFAKVALMLLLVCVCFSAGAAGQGAPLVISSTSTGLAHTNAMGQIIETAITTEGDWLVNDAANGALYEFPANGGAMVTLIAPGGLGSGANLGVALDSNNMLYLAGNWSNCLLNFWYTPATATTPGTWADLPTPNNPSNSCYSPHNFAQYNAFNGGDGYGQGYWNWGVQPWAFTVDANNNLILGNQTDGNYLASLNVVGVGAAAVEGPYQIQLQTMTARPTSVAVDQWENIYYVEESLQSLAVTKQTGLLGVYEIPAGAAAAKGVDGLASDTVSVITRVDPNLKNPSNVTTDPSGNLYIGDYNAGVFMVPSAGGAALTPNTAGAVYLTPLPAQGSVSIDWKRQILYVPTTATQSNGMADVAKVTFGAAEFGSSPVGTATSPVTVSYAFSGSVTPGSFVIEESGAASTDFAVVSGGTCAAATAQAAFSSCTVNVTMTPLSAGGVSAKLLMLDSSKNVLASTVLTGFGVGSEVTVTPALESAIGAGGLKTPSQVAVDAAGNTYVADAGLGEVLMFAAGSTASSAGVSVGTVTAPTGVAVDGAGDVFIGDSGSVYEVANTPSGLAKTQTTLTTGLGTKLNLAVDSLGNLFVADPDNARVVELSQLGGTFNLLSQQETYLTGLTAPSLVAVDGSDNLYVVDGTKLIEGQPNGTPTTLLSTLSGATGLAVDASGSVYVSSASGTVRIASGTTVLSPFTSTVTDAQGVAIDKSGNVYLVDGTALNLSLVSFNGALNFGSPTLASLSTPPVLDATLMNIGNSALTITGFAGSDAVDFTESGTGCDTSLAPNADCTVAVTMNPGAGIQGPISSTIAIKGNDANAAVVLASGTAPALTANSTTISVDKAATVVSVPITVTVGGTDAAPTGNVVISVDGIAMPAAALTTSGTNGTYTVTIITGISAGSHTFSVAYLGDRTYGTSTGSVTATIAKAATVIIVPNPPPYSLEQNTQNEGTYEPYNTQYFEAAYDTFFKVTVPGASGLLPSGNIAFMQGSSVMCGPATTSTYTTHLSSALAYDPNPPLANQADFNPGCLPISNNSNIPNLLTPQLITSIVYLGDANYLGSTATTTTSGKPILFEELRNPSVAITPTPLTISVTAGTPSAVTPLTVTSVQGYGVSTAPNNYLGAGVGSPLNNYTLPLQFACQGLPVHATCTFSGGNFTDVNGVLHPDWLNLSNDPAQPGTINVTVNTNVSEAATTTSKNSQPAPFEFAAMFGVGLVGLAFGRRSGRKARVLMLICLLIITGAVASMTACSTKILGSVTPTTTTPAGTYSVMVTAQEVGAVSVASSSTSSGFVLVYGSENQMSLPYTMTVTVQ